MNFFKGKKIKIGRAEIIFLSMFVIVMLGRLFVFEPIQVSGSSMDPTLHDSERMMEVKQQELKRFDIVTLDAPDGSGEVYIKRVIGLPGEVIAYKEGKLYVDGKLQEEEYLKTYTDKLSGSQPLTLSAFGETSFQFEKIPEGKYLVLGDNRRQSKDSRYFGFVDESSIHGKVIFKIWN